MLANGTERRDLPIGHLDNRLFEPRKLRIVLEGKFRPMAYLFRMQGLHQHRLCDRKVYEQRIQPAGTMGCTMAGFSPSLRRI